MNFKNFAYSTVATAPIPATSGLTLVVAAGEGAKFPSGSFYATVWPIGNTPSTTNAEIVLVTNIATDTFTITRAQESTTARTIIAGDQIAQTITAATINSLLQVPHACISDSTTQTITNTTQAQSVLFDTDEEKYLITHSTVTNSDRIYIDTAGTHRILISAIADLASGTNQSLNMWLEVDGVNVPRSNTIVLISGTAEQTLAVEFMYEFTAGQYFRVMMSGSSTGVRILATGTQTSPTRPACPSIILTVNRVST